MTEPHHCPSCGRPVQSDWNTCPYCRAELSAESPPVVPTATSGEIWAELHADRPPHRRPVPATVERRRDQSLARYGLIALGVLAAVWFILSIVIGGPTASSLVSVSLLGGLVVLVVLIGSVLLGRSPDPEAERASSPRPRPAGSRPADPGSREPGAGRVASAAGVGLLGCFGGLLTGVLAAVLAFLVVMASIIYALEDCLKTCGGK